MSKKRQTEDKRSCRRLKEKNTEKAISCKHARTPLWEQAYPLTQQGQLTILVQIEAEMALKTWPSNCC